MDERKKIVLLEAMEMILLESTEDEESEFSGYSSSSSDEEMLTVNLFYRALILSKFRGKLKKRPRVKDFVEQVVSAFTAEEFKTHFRLLPATFDFILGLLEPSLNRTNSVGRIAIPAKKQLLIALWMMATPDSYRSVCTKFDVGKATAYRTMRRVTKALHKLAPRFIQWPQGQGATVVMAEFERISDFPRVIGAIDGTHVEIKSPNDHQQAYVNRKGYSSIHVQAVCTHTLLFTSVYAGNAGSVHDARVFRLSPIARYLENPGIYFPHDSHLVGDAAYGVHPHIMVPFRDNGHLNLRQKKFNFCLSSARTAIERALGVWKTRWRSIFDCLPMLTLEKIPEYLVATMVLHNVCILNGDLINAGVIPCAEVVRGTLVPGRVTDGNIKREQIMNNLVLRNN